MPTPSSARLHEFVVVENERVAQGLFRLVARAPELAGSLEPGQFENFRVPGDPTQIVRVPLSFSGATPADGTFETVYAVVGDATSRLSSMRPGDASDVLGPCGHGWRLDRPVGRALLVAGGVGVTPVLGLARELGSRGTPFDAVLAARDAGRLWGARELAEAGAGRVEEVTDDGSRGMRGLATDGMAALLDGHAYDLVLTCGPEPMMAAVAELCADRDLDCQVSLERMMTCGFGACATCNVALARGGYASACMDGPVFDAREVAW